MRRRWTRDTGTLNIAQLFARSAGRAADLPAVARGTGVELTQRALAARAGAVAGGLTMRYRLAPGDRVAIVMRNRTDYVIWLAGCWWAGLAAVPVNAALHPSELAWILAHSGARLTVVSPELAASVPGDGPVIVAGTAEAEALSRADAVPLVARAPSDLAWLFYTSGTTGRPKGAMITHGNLLAMTAAFLADVEPVEPGDTILHAAPMSHGSGLYVLPHAAKAACQLIPESGAFDAGEILDLIARWPRVRLFAGSGAFTVNDKSLNDYFHWETLINTAQNPLRVTQNEARFAVSAQVKGGGPVGQAEAVSLGLARALLAADTSFKSALRRAGLLTRDPRAKERKKPGLKKARKAKQYTKR